MGSVKINREKVPMNYDRSTTVLFDPPLTTFQLSSALLDPSEIAICQIETEEIIIKGHGLGGKGAEATQDILSVIKSECIENGDVTQRRTVSPSFAKAKNHILRKYGIFDFKIVGTPNRVVGFKISSYVSYVDPEAHVKRYANILRAVKSKLPFVHFDLEHADCQTTFACDVKLTKLVRELIIEKEPMQPKKEAVT